ncbi:MAG: tyrosine-type recombinase/integrase [Chitinophagia bacterium]|jgi:integrase
MSKKNQKTTTYSLDWETVVNLESRLLRDFQLKKTPSSARNLLIVSIGTRLGLRVIDNLGLKWEDLRGLNVGERFIRIEKKTGKERVLAMSSKLREVLDVVIEIMNPIPSHFIFSSQKGKGRTPMTIQCFNKILKDIMKDYKVRFIGNCSSHLLRKSWVVGSIKKGFESGDHLSLIKVSRLIGHSNISTTLRYTNFETSQALSLYELA